MFSTLSEKEKYDLGNILAFKLQKAFTEEASGTPRPSDTDWHNNKIINRLFKEAVIAFWKIRSFKDVPDEIRDNACGLYTMNWQMAIENDWGTLNDGTLEDGSKPIYSLKAKTFLEEFLSSRGIPRERIQEVLSKPPTTKKKKTIREEIYAVISDNSLQTLLARCKALDDNPIEFPIPGLRGPWKKCTSWLRAYRGYPTQTSKYLSQILRDFSSERFTDFHKTKKPRTPTARL